MRWSRWLSNASLVVMGLLALFAISPVGHAAAIISAISIIGLPLFFVIVLLPSAFLALVAVRLALGALSGVRSGQTMKALACGVSLLAMTGYFVLQAWAVNLWLDARVSALVAIDQDQLDATQPIGTLAVMRSTRMARDVSNPCDDLCLRLLLTRAVSRVIQVTVAEAPQKRLDAQQRDWPVLEPTADLQGMAWRLEPREKCEDPVPLTSLRPVQLPPLPQEARLRLASPVGPEKLMRLKIAQGTCLVGGASALSQADAVLAYGTVHSGVSTFGAGLDAWADTVSAWRISFWRINSGRLVSLYRRTGVAWASLPGALIPILESGAEFRTTNAWLRLPKRRNRSPSESEPPLAAFVTERLGLNLRPVPDPEPDAIGRGASAQDLLRAAQAKSVDAILGGSTAPTDNDEKVIADYVANVGSAIDRRVNGVGVDDAARVLRIAQDSRLPIPPQMPGAVDFAAKATPATATEFAKALADRLDALPPAMTDNKARGAWNEQIRAITGSLAMLPAEAVQSVRGQVIALMHDRDRRLNATRFLGQMEVFGPDIAAQIFAMMDDAVVLRTLQDGSRRYLKHGWADVWRAGAHSLCRLGSQAPGALPELQTRAKALATTNVRIADETVAAAMLRMGASEDEIRTTLAIDPQDERAMKSFGFTVRRARRDDACR
jgi:hypothetical protein